MNTLSQTHSASISLRAEKTKSRLSEFLDELEENRFAFAPMLLVAMACLGGIAAAFAVHGSEVKLMAVAVSTSFVEILVIALAPMRMIALVSVIAFLIDLFVFIF